VSLTAPRIILIPPVSSPIQTRKFDPDQGSQAGVWVAPRAERQAESVMGGYFEAYFVDFVIGAFALFGIVLGYLSIADALAGRK
jgi:hypothetical protein